MVFVKLENCQMVYNVGITIRKSIVLSFLHCLLFILGGGGDSIPVCFHFFVPYSMIYTQMYISWMYNISV